MSVRFAIVCDECGGTNDAICQTVEDAERQWEEDGCEVRDSGRRHRCDECGGPVDAVAERHNDNVMRGLFAGGGL